MYERVFVAVDGSETSDVALAEAIKLARLSPKAALRILSVVDVPAAALTGEGVDEASVERPLLDAAHHVLALAVAHAKEAGIEPESAVNECLGGSVPDAIVGDARAWNADVIVVGTHGRRGWRRMVLGSVAEGVARAADRPVLLVRHPQPTAAPGA